MTAHSDIPGPTAAAGGGDPLFPVVKRVRERWIADPRFRAGVARDPSRIARDYPGVDPAGLAFLWQPATDPNLPASDLPTPEARAFAAVGRWIAGNSDFSHDPASLAESAAPYRAWRARQIARSAFALGVVASGVNLHLPFAVELSQGCSVGCWFCGLSADRLRRNAPADATTLALWRDMLIELASRFGSYGRRGFLFWATDPLDNPDYEVFANAFADRFGCWPSTTTALALRDLARTRALIARARARSAPRLRFSVLSPRALDEIHAAFTAEAMIDVDLVPVNKGSLLSLAAAGRLRRQAELDSGDAVTSRGRGRAAERSAIAAPGLPDDAARHDTIACVSGFLIDLVGRSVRLVTPTPATAPRPDGFVTLASAPFACGASFGAALDGMIARHMPIALSLGRTLAKPPALTATRLIDGVVVAARGHRLAFRRRGRTGHLLPLLDAFGRPGGATVAEATDMAGRVEGAPPAKIILDDATLLWQQGVLVEPQLVWEPDRP